MVSTSSWPSRLVLALLALQLASACKPDTKPPPSGNSDTTPPSTRADPLGGNFTESITVTLTCDDGAGSGCAATYYTLDGAQPSTSSPRYTSPLPITRGTTLKYFSVDQAGNAETPQVQAYAVDGVPPTTVATPGGGILNSARSVALVCTDSDGTGSGCVATYFTTDGTPPTPRSSRYTAPILVSANTTLRFFSVDAVGNTEAPKTESYTVDDTAPTVRATPAGGTYATAQTVTLSCDDGAGTGCDPIRYTTDGSVPTVDSPTYTAPLVVSTHTTLRFRAVDGAGNLSPVVSAVYVIDDTGPATTATPIGALYNTPVSVTLTCDDGAGTGCASTYYTTDGSPPTPSSARYTTTIPITTTTTLKFFSVDTLGNPGPTGTAQYTLDFTAPVTTANPPGAIYSGEQTVVLECKDGAGSGCAATYYTLDGTTPTRSSPRYATPLRITANTTLRFFSVDKANNTESVRTEVYDLDSVAPVTRATPAGGLYKSNQSVVLSCDDSAGSGCVETHYTVDGSTPTLASPKYTSAILLTGNTALKFFSVDAAGNTEAEQTETYTIDTVAPSTSATPAAGTYGNTVSVTLACNDGASGSGCAETRYTVDGSSPTPSSPLYSGALSISATTTLRYFSTDKAGNREPTRVALYTVDKVAPTVSASPRGGLYNTAQSITLTCSDTGGSSCAAIHYTTDGTVPTTASATYSAPLIASATTTLEFLAVDKVGNVSDVQTEFYRIDNVAPSSTATPAGGTYATAKSITLACVDNAGGSGCAATYYTTDGSLPATGSKLYTGAFSLSTNTTLRFFSVDTAGNAEPARTETYTFDMVPPTTTAAPPAGTYGSTVSVTLTCDDGAGTGCAETRYTVDGTTPGPSSPLYSGAISLTATTTLRYASKDKLGNLESVRVAAYVIDKVAPTVSASPKGGTYRTAQTVALTCSDSGGSTCDSIHYTLDGSTPTVGSATYSAPLTLSANTSLKFLAADKVGNVSGVSTESYVIDTAAPVTTAIRAGGAYGSAQSVTLLCADGSGTGCTATYYTLDGSTPTTGSPRYSVPLSITANATLKFFSVDVAGNAESPRTETYLIDTVSPSVTADPTSGTYNSARSVTLSCTDNTGGSGCAAIHYTTDGTSPTMSSPLYTAPIAVSANTLLGFFAVDTVGNVSPTQYESYIIDTVAPVTGVYPTGGTYTGSVYVSLYCDDGTGSGCATTHYTTDGSTPTTASPIYPGYLYFTATTTLKFFSVDVAGNAEPVHTETYTFVPDTTPPTTTASLSGGSYTSPLYVYLYCSDNTWCAGTYYTVDGSEPTTASPVYTGGYIYISSTTTLKFFSVDGAGNAEPVHTETYVIGPDTTPPTTSASPAGGSYTGALYVYLGCSDNSWCSDTYYTLDGSEPTTASSHYYGGGIYISSTTTLKFFSVDGYGNAEPVRTETYTFVPDTTPPLTSASPPGGTYTSGLFVYLYCSDNSWCDSTYYTLDGSEPTTASLRYYGGGFYISTTTTLKFFSVDGAGNAEPVRTETYDFGPDTQHPFTYASPAGGTYASAQFVYLDCYDNTGCNGTYYTLDGSEPTTASSRYSGPLLLTANTTLKFFSVDGAGNVEPVRTETYFITPDTQPPSTSASPAGGTYASPQVVFLSCYDNTACESTYYTLDGSEPTTASPRYYSYVYIPSTATLKFFSVDFSGNAEPVRTETYVIEIPPTDVSAQIARVRAQPDGAISEPIDSALVTYTKATTGLSDPAGFFLQASAAGPALFVAIDPLTLVPTPLPGDRVYLYATQKATVNGMVEITQISSGSFTVYSRGESVEPLRIDASNSDLELKVGDYESTLISFSGTVASDFATAGTGHVSANVVSLGNPTVTPSLKLRLTTSVQSSMDVTQGCSITTNAPLWRFNTQAQPSAWTSADLTVLSCPAPRVVGAAATSDTSVVVAFDRRIDPATVNANGGQFTFDNGLVATSATVTDRQVQLTTSSQVGGTSYRLTVASSILDTRGSALDGSANSASFTGYTSTPTPGIAQLRLSEVSPGITNGRDLVELIAVKGGSVDGFTLTMGATVMATFPNVQVAAGDVIVVHIKPDSTTNGDAAGSETTGKSQFPTGTYLANYDTAWDFLGSLATEIGYSRRVLRVRDATGVVQDGAAFARTGGTPPGDFLTQLQSIQDEGHWLPATCGGVACNDTTALDVSVDWAGCGTNKGGNSVRRVSATDTNTRGDWAVGFPSFGLANP